MMAYGVASIARRGVAFARATSSKAPQGEHPQLPRISAWAIVLVTLTTLGFFALFFAIKYSFGNIVATLTMIESPQSDTYVQVQSLAPANDDADNDDNDAAAPKTPSSDPLLDPEVLLVKDTAITSSIRRTLKLLRMRFGALSAFRGFSLFICLTIARLFIIQFLGIPRFMNNWTGFAIASVLADLALARWEMTWIHIIISEPTRQRWWSRAPPLRTWTKIAPAVALRSAASQLAAIVPIAVGMSFGSFRRMRNPGFEPSHGELNAASAQSLFILVLAIALVILLQLPATVVLVRVAASMLPEENETVVPFDRSFGSKVTPAIVGGQGKVGIVEAWGSFERSAWVRLLKLMGKLVAIMLALWVLVVVVIIGEAHLIIGGENMKAILGFLADRMSGHH